MKGVENVLLRETWVLTILKTHGFPILKEFLFRGSNLFGETLTLDCGGLEFAKKEREGIGWRQRLTLAFFYLFNKGFAFERRMA